jgi:Putative Flp pilus-assembly TadE/G-like
LYFEKNDKMSNVGMYARVTECLKRASQFLPSESGAGTVVMAVALPVLVGAIGVGVDMAVLNTKQLDLQSAADQAALAAVKELAVVNASDNSIKASAENHARMVLNDDRRDIAVDVEISRSDDKVKVTIHETWTPFFAHFLGAGVTPVIVDASAKLAGRTDLCVLALNPDESKAFHMDKFAKLLATGCAVYSNSSDAQGLRIDSAAILKASLVCSVGGVKAKLSAVLPAPTTDCPAIEDPLASRTPPKVGGCDVKNFKLSAGTKTLSPGHYCGGLKVSGDAQVKFMPGEYIISGGDFDVSQSAEVSGKDVAFYFSGQGTKINFTGNTSVAFSGAESGTMAGLLFFGDRDLSVVEKHRINSANANELTGTIYLPRGELLIDPNANIAQDSAYTAIIAHKIEINEGPILTLNNNYSDTKVPVPDGIAVDSQVVLVE